MQLTVLRGKRKNVTFLLITLDIILYMIFFISTLRVSVNYNKVKTSSTQYLCSIKAVMICSDVFDKINSGNQLSIGMNRYVTIKNIHWYVIQK